MMATYAEALEIIDYLEKSNDDMTIAYNIDGVRSDHMPDVYNAYQARVSIEAINSAAANFGKSVSFSVYRVENF